MSGLTLLLSTPLLLSTLQLASCAEAEVTSPLNDDDLSLDYETVARVASLPLTCYSQEFPNKLSQTLDKETDLLPPSGTVAGNNEKQKPPVHMMETDVQSCTRYSTAVSTGTVPCTATGCWPRRWACSRAPSWRSTSPRVS